MADNFGTGVSRVLDPKQTSYLNVIFQEGRPPLDSEWNFLTQLSDEKIRHSVLRGMPSGWLGDAVNSPSAFITSEANSNWFRFGPQFSNELESIMWANVNGWLIPVTGTLTGNPPGSPNNMDTWNRITLPPPPANTGDARIDFVFLEVWKAKVAPNPSTTNKPGASSIYRYGNVEGGQSFLNDDIKDPELVFETSQRVQIQYRIRVVPGLVGLTSYPDGFDPSVIKGQGAAASPTSYIYENMRRTLGDPGLWRAGDGNPNALGTVDGYSYAIPLCTVFRRNSVAWDVSNINGGVSRNPTAVDRTGYKTFTTTATLASNMSASATTFSLVSATGIYLPLAPASPLLIQIGDEILSYSVISGVTVSGLLRGQNGSRAEFHAAGSTVKLLSIRPDGLYTDQVAQDDILDLRHIVNPGGFDYQSLLQTNLDKLLRGKLNSTWKRAGNGSQGPRINYVDYISASGGPVGTTQLLDAPDGIKSIWADPSVAQPVTIPIKTPTGPNPNPVAVGGTLGNTFGSVTVTHTGGGSGYASGDVITVPKSLFTSAVPGSDTDQVKLIAEEPYVSLRFFGDSSDFSNTYYTVANNPAGDLLITLTGAFSTKTTGAFLTVHVQYGPGRGLSRRPDAIHDVMYVSSSPNIATQLQGVPTGMRSMRSSWFPLWSQYQGSVTNSTLPSTAECHVDSGAKSVALTPYRLMTLSCGDPLLTVQKVSSPSLGAMPSNTSSGDPKWLTTDPLGLFSGYGDPVPSRSNMVLPLPRKLVPGFGEVQAPILYQDFGNFAQGINLFVNAPKGASVGAGVSTYVPMLNGSVTYAVFSTRNLVTNTPAVYNGVFTYACPIAGMRFFTDSRGLGRKGLELPPFYGIARLFAVYSANDYKTNGSNFNPSTRVPDVSGATNLLRQNFNGPVLWHESDIDGDPTVILNSEAIDITRGPDVINSFEEGDYVIEASIVGLDRGFFDLGQEPRLVLTRGRSEGLTVGSSISFPTLILPSAPEVGDQIIVSYSRYGYQGDAFNSQLLASDMVTRSGVMATASRYQLMNTSLTYDTLSRPNQKPLEVLASTGFVTTLGTGRFSGNIGSNVDDVRNVGYEPWTVPATSIDPRPSLNTGALASSEKRIPLGSEFVGLTCHLPLGALFRDKDFRGNAVGGTSGDARQFVFGSPSPGLQSSGLANTASEFQYLGCPASVGTSSGVIVHVDGNGDSYNVLTNYRTNRGGSVFNASGFVGGDVGSLMPSSGVANTSGGVLAGLALLVRNVPTNIGPQEVSAGQELLMVVITTARPQDSLGTVNAVQCSTSGTGESYSAADIYRIGGHPLTNDSARTLVTPSNISLSRKSDLI